MGKEHQFFEGDQSSNIDQSTMPGFKQEQVWRWSAQQYERQMQREEKLQDTIWKERENWPLVIQVKGKLIVMYGDSNFSRLESNDTWPKPKEEDGLQRWLPNLAISGIKTIDLHDQIITHWPFGVRFPKGVSVAILIGTNDGEDWVTWGMDESMPSSLSYHQRLNRLVNRLLMYGAAHVFLFIPFPTLDMQSARYCRFFKLKGGKPDPRFEKPRFRILTPFREMRDVILDMESSQVTVVDTWPVVCRWNRFTKPILDSYCWVYGRWIEETKTLVKKRIKFGKNRGKEIVDGIHLSTRGQNRLFPIFEQCVKEQP